MIANRPTVLDAKEANARRDAEARGDAFMIEAMDIDPKFALALKQLTVVALMQWYTRGAQDAIDSVQRDR